MKLLIVEVHYLMMADTVSVSPPKADFFLEGQNEIFTTNYLMDCREICYAYSGLIRIDALAQQLAPFSTTFILNHCYLCNYIT